MSLCQQECDTGPVSVLGFRIIHETNAISEQTYQLRIKYKCAGK